VISESIFKYKYKSNIGKYWASGENYYLPLDYPGKERRNLRKGPLCAWF
jgi:hypothetical protein